MSNAIDLATALLTATLRTGLAPECHAAELAPMLSECDEHTITEAVEMVKRRVTPELIDWIDMVIAIASR